jgi:DNA-binding transcriptional MocR family regulator
MLIRAGSFHAGRRFAFCPYARPQGINIVWIGMDGLGMRADLLDKKLSSWNESDGLKPRVAYIVPYHSTV